MTWPVETIPDEDQLYLRVRYNNIQEDKLLPGAFEPHGYGDARGVSTNWGKHSTAAATRKPGLHPVKKTPRDERDYGVVSLLAGNVRSVPRVNVIHTPQQDNRAHTDIRFAEADKEEIRVKLTRIAFSWMIKLGE